MIFAWKVEGGNPPTICLSDVLKGDLIIGENEIAGYSL
jgi:hypothetical protein